MTRARKIVLFNLAATAVLAGVVALEWDSGRERSLPAIGTPPAAATPLPPAAPAPALPDTPLQQYGEIVERPLFNKERRPDEEEAPANAQASSALDQLTLTGIVHGPGTRFAIFFNGADRKEIHVAEGDSVGAWRLEALGDETVTLRRDGEERELVLFKRGGNPRASGVGQAGGVAARQPIVPPPPWRPAANSR